MKKAYSDQCALLMAARMLITDKEAWTQRLYYRMPARWCMEGAIIALRPSDDLSRSTIDFLYKSIGDVPCDFNDTHTHKQVLAALDKAIELSV